MKIRIGTRGSNLALTQTNWVASQLKKVFPNLETEVIIIKTKGDKILDKALDKIGDKGLFVKELEEALLGQEIDIAVHSMKDMPTAHPEGLIIAPVPQRADHRDVLILKNGYTSFSDIPKGGIVGTGSKRRCYQLAALRPDLTFEPIRGNIETRIKKLETMNLDAVVLAAAGILRLGLENVISDYMDEDMCLAAPAQGALAIQHRLGDKAVMDLLNGIADKEANIQITAERSFLKHTEGSCHVPVGAYAQLIGDNMKLTGLFGTEDGSQMVKKTIQGPSADGQALGKELAKDILKELGDER